MVNWVLLMVEALPEGEEGGGEEEKVGKVDTREKEGAAKVEEEQARGDEVEVMEEAGEAEVEEEEAWVYL